MSPDAREPISTTPKSTAPLPYAPSSVWEGYYESLRFRADDLNPEGLWAQAWLPLLEPYALHLILDLGCGTGGDSLILAENGYRMTGMDYSNAAIWRARAKAEMGDADILFLKGDMAQPLPFQQGAFEVVMSNVALHMFNDVTTRAIVGEVSRLLAPNGIFCFHVNSTADMPYRALRYPRERELESNFWLEKHGQTMHFFDEPYIRDLFAAWELPHLIHRELRDPDTGDIFKCVWQGVARAPLNG